MQSESKLFPNPIRFQLPIGWKPDTYSAVISEDFAGFVRGERVAVKGPFLSEQQARPAIEVDRVRLKLGLPSVEQRCVQLVGDQFPGTRSRITGFAPERSWFLLSKDLTSGLVLPMTKHKASKHFASLDVVDWDVLKERGEMAGITFYNKSHRYEESIFARDPVAADLLIKQAYLLWVLGCGPDLAPRNFLYSPQRPGLVYAVDNDTWANFGWELAETPIFNPRTQLGKFTQRFLAEHPFSMELPDELFASYQHAAAFQARAQRGIPL